MTGYLKESDAKNCTSVNIIAVYPETRYCAGHLWGIGELRSTHESGSDPRLVSKFPLPPQNLVPKLRAGERETNPEFFGD